MTKGIRYGACPVCIRGVFYPSQSAAARALGVSEKTIRNALDAGREDDTGLSKRRGGRPGKPCFYRGKSYPSLTAAARVCGVTTAAVSKALAKASTEPDLERWAA
jgi:hypothetical protein